MKSIRILSTRGTIIIAIVVASILPVSFLFIAFIFRNDVGLDRPGALEELAKSLVAIILSFIGLLSSNAVSRKEIERKSNIFREQIKLRFLNLDKLLKEVIDSPNLIEKTALKNSIAQTIRVNNKNTESFKKLLECLIIELEELNNSITKVDPEMGMVCLDYQILIHKGIITIRDFLTIPTAEKSNNIKLIVESLLRM